MEMVYYAKEVYDMSKPGFNAKLFRKEKTYFLVRVIIYYSQIFLSNLGGFSGISPGTVTIQYEDNFKCFKIINNYDDIQNLQSDLNKLSNLNKLFIWNVLKMMC